MAIFRDFPALCCCVVPALVLLAGCGGPPPPNETAEDYAARINGTTQAPAQRAQQAVATIATALPGAAPGPVERGTITDPAASSCGATIVAEYLGQGDGPAIRQAIAGMAKPRAGVRFIMPGEAQTQDFNNNRLNVMFDANAVIRDFRCG